MPQNCTILCPTDEPERVLGFVRQFFDGRGGVTVEGESRNWAAVIIESGDAKLILNRRVFDRPGDEFARMRSGMWSFFNQIQTEHAAIKTSVLARVEEYALAIGVVAEPNFDEDAGHFEGIFGLAAELDAIVWNGNGVLDAEGSMILDGDGDSEIGE